MQALGAPADTKFMFRAPDGLPVWRVGGKTFRVPGDGPPIEYSNASMRKNTEVVHGARLLGTARGGRPLWAGAGAQFTVNKGVAMPHPVDPNTVSRAHQVGRTPTGRPLWTRANRGYFVVNEGRAKPYRIDQHMIEVRESRQPPSNVLPASRADRPTARPDGLVTRFGNFKLQPHQVNACRLFVKRNVPGLLLYYKVGSGKTLASIAAVENYRHSSPERKDVRAVIVVPASLVDNYRKEIRAANAEASKYTIKTYDEFARMGPSQRTNLCHGCVLVVDEAHRIRNESATGKVVLEAAEIAEKRIMLTGTPLMNRPKDIAALLKAVNPSEECLELMSKFDSVFGRRGLDGRQLMNKMLRCTTLFYEPGPEARELHYPKTDFHAVRVDMSASMVAAQRACAAIDPGPAPDGEAYERLLVGNIDPAFLVKPRQLNSVGDRVDGNGVRSDHPKVTVAADKIHKAFLKGKKCIAFATFRVTIQTLLEELLRAGVPAAAVAVFNGDLPKAQRDPIVQAFNRGTTKVLLLSSAGGEGLDLKHTGEVHIVEPQFNEETTAQVIGRAVRYKSHEGLEPHKRKVDVYKYYMHMPGGESRNENAEVIGRSISLLDRYSADEILERMAAQKHAMNEAFADEVLLPASDANVNSC